MHHDVIGVERDRPALRYFSHQLCRCGVLRICPLVLCAAFVFNTDRIKVGIHMRAQKPPGRIDGISRMIGGIFLADILMDFAAAPNDVVGRYQSRVIIEPSIGGGQRSLRNVNHNGGRT